MTFFLVAALLSLDHRSWVRAAAYPVAFLSLLSYETCYLLFIGFPLLRARLAWRYALGYGVHVSVCAASILAVIAIRMGSGETRMTTAMGEPWEVVYKVIASPFIGFYTSASRLLNFVPEAFTSVDAAGGFAICFGVAIAVSFGLYLLREKSASESAIANQVAAFTWLSSVLDPEGLTRWGSLAVSLFLWLFSYGFTLNNFPPTDVMGRQTSITWREPFRPLCFSRKAGFSSGSF